MRVTLAPVEHGRQAASALTLDELRLDVGQRRRCLGRDQPWNRTSGPRGSGEDGAGTLWGLPAALPAAVGGGRGQVGESAERPLDLLPTPAGASFKARWHAARAR